jgi:hypothetical protein
MISPLPPSAVPASDTRGSGDTKDRQAPSSLFAQLLEEGEAVPSAGAGEVQVALTIPESAIREGHGTEQSPAPLARVFNQDGFFGHAALVGEAGGDARDTKTVAPGALDGTPMPGVALRMEADRPGQGMPLAAAGGRAAHTPAPAHISRAHAARGCGGTAIASPALFEAGFISLPFEPEGAAGKVPARHRLLRAAMDGQSPVQVAISEAEQGLRVTAHVAGLEETERRQLREAITALLARHGLRAEHIQINATPIRGTEG